MAYRIVDREEWGARYGDGAGPAQLPATEVYIHHSVTMAPDMVLPRDDDYAAMRRLDDIGADTFGEQYGISYTFCITPAGLIFEGHSVDQMGAHTKGHNWTARAICFVGNYEENELTEEQIHACAWLLQHGHAQGWWTQPRLTGGHRDVYATACPGVHAYNAIGYINQLAAGTAIQEEEDMQQDERDALFTLLSQSTGSRTPGEYPGWPSWVGNDESLTQTDYLRAADMHLVNLRASVAGLSEAVAALSSDSELTADRVEEIVRDAVQQNIDITGDVQISGSEGQA